MPEYRHQRRQLHYQKKESVKMDEMEYAMMKGAAQRSPDPSKFRNQAD